MMQMNSTSHYQSVVMDIAHEHRELQHRLKELRRLAARPVSEDKLPAVLTEISEALLSLRLQMESHFRKEEAGGVIEEAVTRIPRLAGAAAHIQSEHPELLQRLDKALRMAEVTGPKSADWEKTRLAVDEFTTAMLTHEAAENRLLQQGFNEDLGAFE
jgi:iron-sulfur cluster repair protein YtfE (RIC family)